MLSKEMKVQRIDAMLDCIDEVRDSCLISYDTGKGIVTDKLICSAMNLMECIKTLTIQEEGA